MGDPTKFHSLWEYYAFNVVFTCLLLSELFIFFYTRQRDSCTQTAKRDHGTKWLLYGNFAFCLLVSICSVSQTAPTLLRQMVFPPFVADIGTAFTATGITIRLSAVLTLKKHLRFMCRRQRDNIWSEPDCIMRFAIQHTREAF